MLRKINVFKKVKQQNKCQRATSGLAQAGVWARLTQSR